MARPRDIGYRGWPRIAALLLAAACTFPVTPPEPAAKSISLAHTCPPSFDLDASGRCRFVSLYQLYDSPAGYGGLRVPLPPVRDGFTPAQIDLGRYLFFDPVLSVDQDLSCAHCHVPVQGFADGLGRSRGRGARGAGAERVRGTLLPRGAPSLWNVGFQQRLFWDGRASSLEEQARGPLFAADEMANTPGGVVRTLNAIPAYRALFAQAFDDMQDAPIELDNVLTALAAFQSSLVSFNSRYDRYVHGDGAALTEQEQQGHTVFRSFLIRCSQCHTPPLFSNGQLAVVGAPDAPGLPFDPGAGAHNPDRGLRGAFRVPSLRNVALTAPYTHAGALENLEQVIRFYNERRGHAAPPDEGLVIHWHIPLQGPTLSEEEVRALIAFLGTLTDTTMMPAVPAQVPSGLPVGIR